MKCNNSWNCPAGSFPYTIRKGDTLYSLAKRFETTVERLADINNIKNPDLIYADDTICIPLPFQYYPACRTTNYYIVRENDSAAKIAKYFGVSTMQILYSNIGIDINNLYDGMILCIPLAPPVLCVHIEKNSLHLCYFSGDKLSFPCVSPLTSLSGTVTQKELDDSRGGFKRLNILPNVAITNASGKRGDGDIVLTDRDMDRVFNLVSVGTEVCID